jgi:hypothetical protein
MILFITDNLLKVNQVLPLAENEFSAGDHETPASIKCSKSNIKKLYQNRIRFVLDLEKGEKIPTKHLNFKLYAEGTRMFVPEYVPSRAEAPETYSIQYKKEDKVAFKSGVTEKALKHAIESGVRVRRIAPEQSKRFKKSFLRRFGLEVVEEGDFCYARMQKASNGKKSTRKVHQ